MSGYSIERVLATVNYLSEVNKLLSFSHLSLNDAAAVINKKYKINFSITKLAYDVLRIKSIEMGILNIWDCNYIIASNVIKSSIDFLEKNLTDKCGE